MYKKFRACGANFVLDTFQMLVFGVQNQSPLIALFFTISTAPPPPSHDNKGRPLFTTPNTDKLEKLTFLQNHPLFLLFSNQILNEI